MYYLAGTSAILKGLNVWNGFAWFDELKAAFLKFPVVDKLTEAKCDCKQFGFPKCVGRGAWQSTLPIQVKISCLKMVKTVLTLILYSELFCCLVSHNKYSDIYFDKKTALNSFLYRFYTEL